MTHKILLLIMVMLLLSGCSEKEVVYADAFVRVETQGNSEIFVDTKTKVMYWQRSSSGIGITVILNEDGTPKLWEGKLPKDGDSK